MVMGSADQGSVNEGQIPTRGDLYLVGIVHTLIKTFVAVIGVMAAFQVVKHIVFPHVTMWESHVMTNLVVGLFSTVAVYFALRRKAELL